MRLVAVHGFTQSGRVWESVLPGAETVDLPGHGTNANAQQDLWQTAAALSKNKRAVWLGYSLGGRVCLHLALAYPDAVDRLILVSTTAGIDDPAERAARRNADDALADRIEAIGVPAFIDEWLRGPLWTGLAPDQRQLESRLINTPEGLASSLRLAGTGTQEPLWDRLRAIDKPTLIITGRNDAKFTELGKRLENGIPNAQHIVIEHAGHAVPWEQPEAFTNAVQRWMSQADADGEE